ncbi:MAG TPA: polymer-forming cytoskeletal protein [Candidatus Saccharimonadales bacterium]|nr:polymer-forming cytoskeletal protein [Candidatus Saccharimonadales bacterium]
MRKLRFVLLAGLVIVAVIVGVKGLTSANAFHVGTHVDLSSSQKVDSSVYVAGRNINIAADVNGDIFCAGQDVHISGTVHGDVLCAGQTVSVSGTVDGNVRLVGQTVTVSGQVSGSASVAAQTFTLDSHAKVGRDLSLAGSDSEVLGAVGRDIALAAQTVSIDNKVGRDVTGTVQDFSLESGAVIAGNLSYTSNNTLSKNAHAQVLGAITRHTPPKHEHHRNWAVFWWMGVTLLFFALILALTVPRLLRSSATTTLAKPLQTFGVGLLVLIGVPILTILFVITAIGIPVAAVLGLTWVILMLLSAPFFAFFVGRWILGAKANIFLAALLGVVLIVGVGAIPFVGFVSWFATVIFGLGSLGLLIARSFKKPVYGASE